jgi:hypothetical protein
MAQQRLHRLLVAGAGEGDQRGGGESCLFDRDRRIFLEVALQPASRKARVAARILPGDKRVSSSASSSRLSCGSSSAAATAAITFLRWSAFWKIPSDRPAEVDVPASLGPESGHVSPSPRPFSP